MTEESFLKVAESVHQTRDRLIAELRAVEQQHAALPTNERPTPKSLEELDRIRTQLAAARAACRTSLRGVPVTLHRRIRELLSQRGYAPERE